MKKQRKARSPKPKPHTAASSAAVAAAKPITVVAAASAFSASASVGSGSGLSAAMTSGGKKRQRAARTSAERAAQRLHIDDEWSRKKRKEAKMKVAKVGLRKTTGVAHTLKRVAGEQPVTTMAKLAALIAPMRVRLLVARLQPLDEATGRYVIPTATKSEPSSSSSSSSSSGAIEYNDRDPIVGSKIADKRGSFLQFCMENHLQFDSLRRAKHSTALVLHMLHNPTQAVISEVEQRAADAALAVADAEGHPEGGGAAPPPVPQPRAFDVITSHAPELTYSAAAAVQAVALVRKSLEQAAVAESAAQQLHAPAGGSPPPSGLSSLAAATSGVSRQEL
mgnify:CR=1 FL=1